MSFALLLAAVAYTAPYGRTTLPAAWSTRAASAPATRLTMSGAPRSASLSRTPSRVTGGFRAAESSSSASSTQADNVEVFIEVTGINSRGISASIVVDTTPAHIWSILTDYGNLATHVPNLVKSDLVPHPTGGTRLFQEGAQNIIGFDFRASLTMDMVELVEEGATRPTRISFDLVESAMFAAFDGEWRIQPYSRTRSKVDPNKFEYKTKLSYRVNITPRGLVPVPALEWQIREEVPNNLRAVKAAAERLARVRAEDF